MELELLVTRLTQAILTEGLNEDHRLLKMRARPKILLAEDFDEAQAIYEQYRDYVFGVISDTRMPRGGVMDPDAGWSLLNRIRTEIPDLPLLLLLRRSWVPRLFQVLLGLGALEWLRTLYVFASMRVAFEQPWGRLALILGGVALLTALSALVFLNRRLRARYAS